MLMSVGLQLRDLLAKIGDLVGEVLKARQDGPHVGDLAELVGEATDGGGLLCLAGGEGGK